MLTVVVDEDELAEIGSGGLRRGGLDDRKAREAAVGLFLADTVWGLMQ